MINEILKSPLKNILSPLLEGRGKLVEAFPYPTGNLVGFWTNEAITQSSTVAVDYTSNANNATLSIAGTPPIASPTGTAINMPSGGTISIPQIAAYNSVRNIFFWCYNDNTFKNLFSSTTTFAQSNSTGGGIFDTVTTNIGGSTVYVNGQTEPGEAGLTYSTLLQPGYNFVVVTTPAAFNAGAISLAGPLLLDRLGLDDGPEFTAQQVLDMYNATSSNYS
jgi:hypothetical protein